MSTSPPTVLCNEGEWRPQTASRAAPQQLPHSPLFPCPKDDVRDQAITSNALLTTTFEQQTPSTHLYSRVCAHRPRKTMRVEAPMQQLTEQEKKRIQRYCTYPKIAATALVMSFVACLLMLPLQMINDIAFHQKEFQPAGIYTAIALTAIELAIFCYCALAPRFGMQGKQWKELQSRLAVAQTNKDRSAEVASVLATQAAGRLLKNSDNDLARNLGGAAEVASAVGAVATAADVLAETASNAEAMANAYGVTIPSVKKQIIALAVVPVIVLLGVYIPQFAQGNNGLQARKAAAAEQLAIAQDALEPVCERVAADDPYESYHDYGYRIIGYLRDNALGAQAAYIYLSFDVDGTLTDVDYVSQIDPEASLADNLARAEQDIATLCAPLNGLDISVATPDLLTPCSLSDEFKQTFLAGSLYEEISIKTEDESIKSYYTFDTEPKEEFDEYTHPEIRLMLSAKED